MKRSDNRILTTHVGSLPRPNDLIELYAGRRAGQRTAAAAEIGGRRGRQASRRPAASTSSMTANTARRCARSADIGAWWTYVYERLVRVYE